MENKKRVWFVCHHFNCMTKTRNWYGLGYGEVGGYRCKKHAPKGREPIKLGRKD